MGDYTFGDTDLASERLQILDAVRDGLIFDASRTSLLARLRARVGRHSGTIHVDPSPGGRSHRTLMSPAHPGDGQ